MQSKKRKAPPASNGANNDSGRPPKPWRNRREIRVTVENITSAGPNIMVFTIPAAPAQRIRDNAIGNEVTVADVIADSIRFRMYPGRCATLDGYSDDPEKDEFTREEIRAEWPLAVSDDLRDLPKGGSL